jgi:hypothetical protein
LRAELCTTDYVAFSVSAYAYKATVIYNDNPKFEITGKGCVIVCVDQEVETFWTR